MTKPDPDVDVICPVCGRAFRYPAGRATHIASNGDDAHVAYAWTQGHYVKVLRARPDYFLPLLEELGEEVLGLRWLAVRPLVAQWVRSNPERVYWLTQRIRNMVRRGEL